MKGRWALLELGQSRPDVIDSGVLNWNPEQYGPDNGRVKMKLSFATQASLPRPARGHSFDWDRTARAPELGRGIPGRDTAARPLQPVASMISA